LLYALQHSRKKNIFQHIDVKVNDVLPLTISEISENGLILVIFATAWVNFIIILKAAFFYTSRFTLILPTGARCIA